jgi:hypothetical protein
MTNNLTPLSPMPRSPTMNSLVELDKVESTQEIDWVEEWENAQRRDDEKRIAEANARFQAHVRARMFRNVLGTGAKK